MPWDPTLVQAYCQDMPSFLLATLPAASSGQRSKRWEQPGASPCRLAVTDAKVKAPAPQVTHSRAQQEGTISSTKERSALFHEDSAMSYSRPTWSKSCFSAAVGSSPCSSR